MTSEPTIRVADPAPGAPLAVVLTADRPIPAPLRRRVSELDQGLATALESDEEPPAPDRVIRAEATPAAFAAAGAELSRRATDGVPRSCLVAAVPAALLTAFGRGLVLGAQRLKADEPPVDFSVAVAGADRSSALQTGIARGHATLFARHLANTPSNVKDPRWLADQALALTDLPGLTVTECDQDWLRREGFAGVLAVGGGSSRPPYVVELHYRGPDAKDRPHVALVGKGITFDSGGLSLKPPTAMPLMKTDMSGAAAVIATMRAVATAGLPLRVSALIACAENMPSGSAMRPGDVIRQRGGRTTEIRNTDAEGRLVLADCLAYAAEQWRPDVMVDLATLTGAATVGLGRQHAALYATTDRLARRLEAAGRAAGEPAWRMPLVPEYAAAIATDVADAANSNTDDHTQAGSITAALFLQPFAGAVEWAHLDIAGTGRTESDRADCRKGATGYGVGLLTEWLSHL